MINSFMPSKEASVEFSISGDVIDLTPTTGSSTNHNQNELVDAVNEKLRIVPSYGSVQGAPAT